MGRTPVDDRSGVRQALDRFAAALRERYGEGVVELRVFGSYARDQAHEESDVDIAVVMDRADWERRRLVIDLATDVGLDHGVVLSPTVFDRATYLRWCRQERPLVMDIERDGMSPVTGDGRGEAAAEDLELSEDELSAARHLLAGGHPRIALARAYFAVFHAARACLYREGLEPRTHAGVLQLWSLHFVKTGRYNPSTARLLARLQKFREEADYSRSFVVDDAGATEELEAAEAFVEGVRRDLARE